jgi:hypothetical protein
MSSSGVTAGRVVCCETEEAYLQGLRDAEALFEEGCLTGEEAEREKGLLAKQRAEGRAAASKEQGGPSETGRDRTKRKLCEHGRLNTFCRECRGRSICKHSKIRSQCRECGGSRFCEHGRVKYKCRECKGTRAEFLRSCI